MAEIKTSPIGRYVRILCGFPVEESRKHFLTWFSMLGVGGYFSALVGMILEYTSQREEYMMLLILTSIAVATSFDPSSIGKRLCASRRKKLPKDWVYFEIEERKNFYMELCAYLERQPSMEGCVWTKLALSQLLPEEKVAAAMVKDGFHEISSCLILDLGHYVPPKYYRLCFVLIEAVTNYSTPLSKAMKEVFEKTPAPSVPVSTSAPAPVPAPSVSTPASSLSTPSPAPASTSSATAVPATASVRNGDVVIDYPYASCVGKDGHPKIYIPPTPTTDFRPCVGTLVSSPPDIPASSSSSASVDPPVSPSPVSPPSVDPLPAASEPEKKKSAITKTSDIMGYLAQIMNGDNSSLPDLINCLTSSSQGKSDKKD